MGAVTRAIRARMQVVEPMVVDGAIAAVILVVAEVRIFAGEHGRDLVVQAVAAVALAVPVALRRRWTMSALVLAAVAVVGGRLLVTSRAEHGHLGPVGLVATLLLTYAAGAFLEGRRSFVGLAIAIGIGATLASAKSGPLQAAFGVVAFVVLPWAVGRAQRRSRSRESAARRSTEQVDAERELRVMTATVGERMRLAREIHDVVAHSMSVMVIQAAGARSVMDHDPVRAETALLAVERAGRDALAEMRRLLGVLVDGADPRMLAPQPCLDDLPELVRSTQAAGLLTELRVEGDPIAVSQGLSLCAYRVVQEALTNALKHAGPTRAEVRVRWHADLLELFVTDAGTRERTQLIESSGHGIAGMRERAALHGGTVEVAAVPQGGFAVHARLPVPAGEVVR